MQNRVAQQNKGKGLQLPKNNNPERVTASKTSEALGQLYALARDDAAARGIRVPGGQ